MWTVVWDCGVGTVVGGEWRRDCRGGNEWGGLCVGADRVKTVVADVWCGVTVRALLQSYAIV